MFALAIGPNDKVALRNCGDRTRQSTGSVSWTRSPEETTSS